MVSTADCCCSGIIRTPANSEFDVMLPFGTAVPDCRGVLTTELRLASSRQTLPSFSSGLLKLPRTCITSLIPTDLACTGGPANSRELSIAKQDRRVLCLILRKKFLSLVLAASVPRAGTGDFMACLLQNRWAYGCCVWERKISGVTKEELPWE